MQAHVTRRRRWHKPGGATQDLARGLGPSGVNIPGIQPADGNARCITSENEFMCVALHMGHVLDSPRQRHSKSRQPVAHDIQTRDTRGREASGSPWGPGTH